MLLIDVNVLVYAHREDTSDHDAYLAWLESVMFGEQAYGMADLVLSGFLRVVTHPRIFDPPSPLADALEFANAVRSQPNCVRIEPSSRHWEIFERLCRSADARGNLVPDAYVAALAIDSGSRWFTTDRDFARFEGLDWAHPLDG